MESAKFFRTGMYQKASRRLLLKRYPASKVLKKHLILKFIRLARFTNLELKLPYLNYCIPSLLYRIKTHRDFCQTSLCFLEKFKMRAHLAFIQNLRWYHKEAKLFRWGSPFVHRNLKWHWDGLNNIFKDFARQVITGYKWNNGLYLQQNPVP